MAGYKTITIMSLIIVVALAGVSPVFAPELGIRLDPASACPGEVFVVYLGGIIDGVGPLALDGGTVVLSSYPDGLIDERSSCQLPITTDGDNLEIPICKVLIKESASCGHYTVTVRETIGEDSLTRILGSGTFDVAGSCCAVGGCVQPVNTFALLSPWLAVIGLIGCIGIVVVAKKRQS